MEARLSASENENVLIKEEMEASADYTPDARLTRTLRLELEKAHNIFLRAENFDDEHPGILPHDVFNQYTALFHLSIDRKDIRADPRKSENVQRKVEELQRLIHKHLNFFWTSPNGQDGNLENALSPKGTESFRICLSQAVNFKLDLMKTTTRLNFFYYKSGEPFDDERMERCMFSVRQKNTIKACLFPLLLFSPAQEPTTESDDYVLEHNFQYIAYFTRLHDGNHLDLELAAKAIILT
ncbi:hypothetical protein FBEOM_12844 [Fusarium beomiforme]|uniref:Uncharacterized protein n=1 Tax=Fusarium beomiforme TaxID=44412 RepID=A0A9P5A7F2_9HYPO|nr:hypothetical protein FBEOM_12844 [Fusarium beomiforme]